MNSTFVTALKMGLAIAFLAIALSFDNAWPGFGIVPQPDISIEALLIVALGIFLLMRQATRSSTRAGLPLLGGLLTVMVILHYVNVTVPALFGRPFNLFWDGRHLPQVLVMAANNTSVGLLVLSVLAVLAGLTALYAACRWALLTICQTAVASGHGRQTHLGLLIAASTAGLVALFSPAPWCDHVVRPLTATYGKQALLLAAVFVPGATDRLLSPSPSFAGRPSALHGADVMLVFSESYGVSTFEDPAMANSLQSARARLQVALSASQRHSASALVVSPTFGGGSWLAHAALLSGVDMREADHHSLLLASQRPTLVKYFKANGYRSIALMPGLRSDWPEGGFYGFDQIYDSRSLDYSGPEFGFWRIPDQYSLGYLHSRELLNREQLNRELPNRETPNRELLNRTEPPRFIVFPTITSHLPFEPVPPLARDWSFARTAESNSAFNQLLDPSQVQATLTGHLDWRALRQPYIRSMNYSLDWLAGYLSELAPRNLLLIVIGDHQPAATVVGRDADWVVPIHVISDSPELIQRFVKAGFAEGLQPRRPAIGQMHELTPLLIRLSGAGEPASVDVSRARTGG